MIVRMLQQSVSAPDARQSISQQARDTLPRQRRRRESRIKAEASRIT